MTSEANLQPAPISTSAADEVDIDLMYFVVRTIRGYRWIFGCMIAGALISAAIGLSLPKTYTAQSLFMPPMNLEASQASSFMLREDPSDLYMGMLSSRSVADSVIDQVHLLDAYHTQSRFLARAQLAAQSKFTVDKNTLIGISVTTTRPELSAAIANAYLEALYKVNGQMSASASAHRSQFFEAQIEIEKNALADAEVSMKQMQEKTGMVLPQGEAEAGLSATARLEADIQDAEARLSSLLTGNTEQNPQVVRLRAQIAALKAELHQQQASSSTTPGSGIASTAKMPAIMLDYIRKSRDLKQKESLYNSLVEQYEKARLASLDAGPQLQIIDLATVPERKSGPPRTMIVLIGTVLGALLGMLKVLLTAPARRLLNRYSEVSAKLQRN